jgi:hypothetical protein
MKWTGIVFPGQPEYELYGDAKSIYEQIITINPSYNAGDSDSNNQTTLLTKRNKIEPPSCGTFATGSDAQVLGQASYLSKLSGSCHVNAKSCIRLACDDTTGTYVSFLQFKF